MKKNNKKKNNKFINKIKKWFKKGNDKFSLFDVIIITFVSLVAGIFIGYMFVSTKIGSFGNKITPELKEIVLTYNNILSNYYGKLDEKDLMNSAISGMIGSLDDPYSLYMDDEDTSSFNQSVDGEYVGIGVTIYWKDGKFLVQEVMKDSPAAKKGVKKGDYLIAINHNDITSSNLEEVSKMLAGDKNDTVTITVRREEEEKEFKLKRSIVKIQSVHEKIIDKENNIGYIKVDNFAANTSEQFDESLDNLIDKKINSLILDLRYNSGGRLTEVDDMLDRFLDKNVCLYQIENKGKIKKVKSKDKKKLSIPVVVLINESSASASEILASSLQDNYKNIDIVGTISYGKGTIQKALELSNGSSLKFTTQKWLTAKGEFLGDKGVVPNVKIQQGDKFYEEPTDENDVQLDKAIDVIIKKEK